MTTVKTNSLQIISSIFIFLFVYTALCKIIDFQRFVSVLGKSPLIGNLKNLAAWIIPSLELFVALLLFFPSTRRTGLYSSFGLMFIFTAYVCYMLLFVPHLPCSCGGVIQQMNWKQHLLFNIFFTALAFFAIVLYRNNPPPSKAGKQIFSYGN